MWLAAPFDSTSLEMSTPAILTRYTWKEKTKPSMRETAGQEQQTEALGCSGTLGVWRSFSKHYDGNNSWIPLGPFSWKRDLRPKCRCILHTKQRVHTPCCLQSYTPGTPRTYSPGAAMECGFVPVTLKFRGKFNCTADVPHTGCRTGILFYCN